jgi:signal transduction histidine kinase
MEAENQRVMRESLAAVCHHIGQPATVIAMCLALLKREQDTEKIQCLLTTAQAAVDQMASVLKRMETLQSYQTEPYLTEALPRVESLRLLVIEDPLLSKTTVSSRS